MILKLSYFIIVVISTYPLLTFCTSIAPQNSENSDLLPPNAFEESLRLELYNSTEDSSDSEEFEFDRLSFRIVSLYLIICFLLL